jgi:excinuclease ABC subunit A
MTFCTRALARQLYRSREEPGAHKSISGAENIDKVIRIDQSPIGRTPRSNPATYTGVFTADSRSLRHAAGVARARLQGGTLLLQRFRRTLRSLPGRGQRRIEMNFLPDVYVLCEVCGGKRYNHETLAVKYKGYSIADLLEMPVSDALPFWRTFRR